MIKKSQVDYSEHQKKVSDYLKNNPGLLLYWKMGSGKTLASIGAADPFGGATVITPASLRTNFQKEIDKAKGTGNYDILSYDKLVRSPDDVNIKPFVILDEAHRIKNIQSDRTRLAIKKLKNAEKIMLLTGTPIPNKPSDIAPLIDIISKQQVLPLDPNEFNAKYINEVNYVPTLADRLLRGASPYYSIEPKNLKDFAEKIKGKVSFYEPTLADYPEIEEKFIRVPMNNVQEQVYDIYANKYLTPDLKSKIKNLIPPDKQDTTSLNRYMNAVRQIVNNPGNFSNTNTEIPLKYKKILNQISKSTGPALIYSNYLDSGIKPLDILLQSNNISTGLYTGELNDKQKKKLVDEYNKGKIKALLISGAGGEGLDLKGTRQVHIMEPWWNEPKIDQVIGRAVRYKSHDLLPPEDRKVEVFRYLSTKRPHKNFSQNLFNLDPTVENTVDDYLTDMSIHKKKLNDKFLQILKENSI